VRQPLLALLAARAVTAAAALWAGVNPLRLDAWVRWDSNLYLSIAQRGYYLEHCAPASGYEPWQWCGNAGWFPLYAWMLKIAPGAVLSLIFQAILLFLVWRKSRNWPVLLLAALFPGCIYQQAVFPVSLFLVCALFFLEYWRPEAGALAAMAYPTGALLVPVALMRRKWLAALGVLAGFLVVVAVMRAQTGRWDAYVLTQAKYAFHFAPVDTLFSRLKPLVNAKYRDATSFTAAAQTLLVLVMIALSVKSWLAKPEIAAYSLAYWLFPLCVGGRLSLYRAESLLVPVVFLLPERARIPLLAVAAPIAFAMSVAFFRGSLV
jgi:hypothetical protein